MPPCSHRNLTAHLGVARRHRRSNYHGEAVGRRCSSLAKAGLAASVMVGLQPWQLQQGINRLQAECLLRQVAQQVRQGSLPG